MGIGLNSLAHALTAATVWLWAGVLCGLWGRVLGPTGPNLWLSTAAAMGAFAVGLTVPARFFSMAQTVLRWIYPRGTFSMPPITPATADVPQQVSRLLGVALLTAAAGSLVSTLALRGGAVAIDWVATGFLLPELAYRVVQVLLQTLVMLTWGLGAALVYQAQTLAHDERDGQAPGERTFAEWAVGIALAAGVLAAGSWVGVNPLGLGFVAAAVQTVIAVRLIGWHRGVQIVPADGPRSGRTPSVRLAGGVVIRAAAITLVGTVQLRATADLLAAGAVGQMLFLALSAGAVGAFGYRWGQKHFLRSHKVAAGAGTLAVATLAVQLTLALLTVASGATWLVQLALTGQVLLGAAVTLVLLSYRRRYIAAGGTPRHWLQWTLMGAALGACAGAMGVGAADGRPPTLVAMLIAMSAAVVVGIVTSRKTGRQIVWAVAGGALLLSITLSLAAGAMTVRTQRLALVSGQWLTAWEQSGTCGYLPKPRHPIQWRLDRQLAAALARPVDEADYGANWLHPGPRWLIASRRPLISDGGGELIVRTVAADAAVGQLPAWDGVEAGNSWSALRAGPFQYHGVFYAPMRADHPQAATAFAPALLANSLARTAEGGVYLLHVPCQGENAAPMLSVAKTLAYLAGEVLFVVRTDVNGAELAAVHLKSGRPGWVDTCRRDLAGMFDEGTHVLTGAELAPLWADVPMVQGQDQAPCGAGAMVSVRDLVDFLASKR